MLQFGLTERAIAAARMIEFVPAIKGGRPVSTYMQLEYNFVYAVGVQLQFVLIDLSVL
jgi:hypothetical protein